LDTGFGSGYFKINPPPEDVPYKHLEVVGVLSRRVPLAKDGPNFISVFDNDYLEFKKVTGVDCSQLERESTYERVRALEKNAWISIDKCDVGPFDMSNDSIFDLVLNFMDILMEPVLRTNPHTSEVDIKMSASPGLPYTLKKIKDKKTALESQIFKDLKYRSDYIPLASIATKDEFLPIEDLNRNKVRTTFSTPIELILKSKLFFEQQNRNIKEASSDMWIQYGMTKQYGGFDAVLQKISSFSHCVQSDASGYDRSAYLYWVYYLRWKHLGLVSEVDETFWHVVLHSIFPYCVCPDGTVFMRQTGNNSGANNTATDNSILHQMIVLYLLIYAYFKKHKYYPSLEEILDNAYVPIYSDDKIGGINFSFFGWDNEDDFRNDEIYIYSKFNMVIKPSSVLVTKISNGRLDSRHEFLGSSAAFHEESGRYLGYPRIGKICSSVTRLGLHKLDDDQKFWKLLALQSLSVTEPWLFDIILQYIKYRIYRSDQPTYYKELLQEFGGETIGENLRLHLGFESRQCFIGFNSVGTEQSSKAESLCFNLDFFLKPGNALVGGGFKNYNMNTNNPIVESSGMEKPSEAMMAKARRVIAEAKNSGNLSNSGFEWLKLAIDPWHDNKVDNFKGIPDSSVGASVVMSITQELNLAKPSSFPAGNWNVRIYNAPVATGSLLSKGLLRGNSFVVSGVSGYQLGNIMVDYSSGTNDFDEFSFNASTLNIPTPYLQGPYKVAGMGFEVCNTTAVLQQQGLCTVSQMNQEDAPFTLTNYADSNNFAVHTVVPIRTPPKNLAEAILLPNTTQWHAKEGSYSVIPLLSIDTRPASSVPIYPLVHSEDFKPDTTSLVGQINAIAPQVSPVTWGGITKPIPGLSPGYVPCNTTTAMYTGLSEQTTLTLRVRWILERFPNDNEPEIMVLATPTAPRDDVALEIWSRLINKIPPAVMFKENNTGEWWKRGLASIADILGSALMRMPHPLAKGAGGAILLGRQLLGPEQAMLKVSKKGKIKQSNKSPMQFADNQIATQKQWNRAANINANLNKPKPKKTKVQKQITAK